MKISNSKARQFVQNKLEFKGNNLFAEVTSGVYKVYSYGRHFPIYAYKDKVWYKNVDKYSLTTSKHQSQLHPLEECLELNTEAMKAL